MTVKKVEFLIIGGGPGGTPAAMALAAAGKDVMLVEKGPGLGGTCLFEGCIPSKIFRESARRFRELKDAADFGLCLPTRDVTVNWSAVLERKRSILTRRGEAALQGSRRFPTLNTAFGACRLLDARSAVIESADGEAQQVNFDKAILATGSRPFIPPIKGSDHPRVYDSESILNIDHIPKRLVIIGGGPIGVELGQVFNTLGSDVTIFEATSRILGPVDEELATGLQQRMLDDGIDVVTDCKVRSILTTGQNVFVEYTDADGAAQHKLADTVLMVTGRRPAVDGLGLEMTRIEHGPHGIVVDENMETGESGIYAVGDVVGQPMFAHWATAQGLALARRLLGQPVAFPSVATNSAVIFSEPEIGMVGLTEKQARQSGLDIQVARYAFKQDARAQISGNADGALKILFESDSHKIIGVHVMVEGAGELMGEAALLVRTGATLEAVASTIHPHPTLTESFAVAARNALAAAAQRSSET